MSRTHTSRSLELLRKEGWLVEVVEQWNNFSKRKKDLFGFIDIIGVREGQTIGVQVTSYSNRSARRKKIQESENLEKVLEAGWIIEIHAWHKKNGRWKCIRERIDGIRNCDPIEFFFSLPAKKA